MAALVQVAANNVLDATLGTAAFVATTTPMHTRYMTSNGTATAAGTELATGGGYTAVTGFSPTTFAAGAAGSAASNVVISTTNMPSTTLVGIELWDSTATPARKWYGPLTASKVVNAGDTFSIASGSLTVALA